MTSSKLLWRAHGDGRRDASMSAFSICVALATSTTPVLDIASSDSTMASYALFTNCRMASPSLKCEYGVIQLYFCTRCMYSVYSSSLARSVLEKVGKGQSGMGIGVALGEAPSDFSATNSLATDRMTSKRWRKL